MSTTHVCTRSSRLNSLQREPSTKTASEKKLRSKKMIVTNKSSQKINSAKNKGLHVSETNVSLNKSQPLSRRLRPRRNKKNYCEDSKLLQQHIPLKQQESMVMVEKLNLENNEKVPIYKAMRSFERSEENKNNVYDFIFDINDTTEKAIKKKQKRKINKKSKTKKTTHKKVTVQSKIIDNERNKSLRLDTNPSVKPAQKNPPPELITIESTKRDEKKIGIPKTDLDIQIVKELVKEGTGKKRSSNATADIQIMEENKRKSVEEVTEKRIETPRTSTDIQITGETIYLPDVVFPEEKETQDAKKPKIISIENADNITVIKSPPSNTEEFWPFRQKNIFHNKILKQKNTLNSSLLTKSLSPILKTTNTFDLGSPWRPTLPTFSRVKHFIQSTPKLKFENNMENMKNKENMNKENMEMSKENMEMNKENMEINKENMELNKKNIEIDKENVEMNKQNKYGREKGKKKKTFHKNIIRKKLSTNQAPEKIQAADTNKQVVQQKQNLPESKVEAKPVRISLGEIKNLLQTKSDINDKKATDQTHVEVDKSLTKEIDKNLIDFLNFSDTFDVLSETERLSNVEAQVPLFMDLEPTHFSKPPQHSYRRKRVKFNFEEVSDEEEEEKENVKHYKKKKKITKSEKENEKRINEWIKSINSTFEEIDEHDLVIE